MLQITHAGHPIPAVYTAWVVSLLGAGAECPIPTPVAAVVPLLPLPRALPSDPNPVGPSSETSYTATGRLYCSPRQNQFTPLDFISQHSSADFRNIFLFILKNASHSHSSVRTQPDFQRFFWRMVKWAPCVCLVFSAGAPSLVIVLLWGLACGTPSIGGSRFASSSLEQAFKSEN